MAVIIKPTTNPMPHRIIHAAGAFGTILDISVFGTVMSVVLGFTPSEMGALMAGVGALLVGIGRGAKFLAEARREWTFSDPHVYRKLERIKCHRAPECPTREIFPLDEEHES